MKNSEKKDECLTSSGNTANVMLCIRAILAFHLRSSLTPNIEDAKLRHGVKVSGKRLIFYSSPDEQKNTAKLLGCEVPREPFSGGSCTPDSVERHAFLFPQILLSNYKCCVKA